MIRRIVFLIIILFAGIFSLTLPSKISAAEQFAVDATVTYKVEDSGNTQVMHDIALENLFSSLYATTYTLSLDNINADKIKAADDNGNIIPTEIQKTNQRLNIKLTFNEAVVGQGKRRRFKISYENSNFAVKTGEVWEIAIPRLGDNESFRNYLINLEIPDSFGQEAYISPQATNSRSENGYKIYSFSKDVISETGVTAGFGQFQVFAFNLSYHLENPLNVSSQTEVALPPDTAFQKVYYSKVEPKPVTVRIDKDGNYLAVYKLSARQRVDINVEGSVQIFAGFRPFPAPTDESLSTSLLPTNYWQTQDPNIKMLAGNLKTPKAIYDFVSTKLKYDFSRVQPNATRLGAANALQSPSQAICMEFTDLFVALARAAGIPAREINGYAYTENRELQPLSLVADVLHAWPEYYDKDKGVWIPVDPTWGSTSGVDYFNKLDLRHFTFVIHGANDREPYPPGSYKLGPNPQKDVFVSFGSLPSVSNSVPQIKITRERNIPFLDTLYVYRVYNPGPATLYSFYPSVYFDGKLRARPFVQILPPFAAFNGNIEIPYSLLGKNMPDTIKIVVNESHINFSTNKSQVVINTLVMLFAVFIFIVILVLVKLKKINFERIAVTISHIYAKITRKPTQNSNNS